MATVSDPASPLSKDEWDALQDFLDAPGGPNLDFCVGFLTAVATAPTLIPPSEWLPVVLGDRILDSLDDPHVGLVFRMYSMIASGLPAKDVFCPPADEVEAVEEWCRGYLEGVVDPAWIESFEAITPVLPIAVLAGKQPLNDPENEDHIDDEEGWKQDARERLGNVVIEAFFALAAARRAGGRERAAPKIGRNDPCPCGSGKKYKKCCLGKDGVV